MTRPNVTRQFAEFVIADGNGSPPSSALKAGIRTFANAVALAAGSSRHPAVETALETVQALGSAPGAGILGRSERISPLWAPLVNGISIHVEDFDDTHLPTVIHPGAPVVPAALAAAELSGASGTEVVEAVTLGVEVALRVGNGICPSHFNRGWHLTGTVGPLGAAVAAGRILQLNVDEMVVAMGLAATQAAGLQKALGTMTKPFHPGKAAANGLEAALLAKKRFTGPAAPIEGRRGFAEVSSPEADYDLMTQGLGETWEVELNTFKPYACGIVSHPVIDGAIALRDRVDAPGQIAEVETTVNPVVLDVMGVEEPQDALQSKFSVYHCFAVGFLDGAAGPSQFSDTRACSPEVVTLRRKVRAVLDPEIGKDEARVRVRTSNGGEIEHHVAHATGSAAVPMTDEQLQDKAQLAVRETLGERSVEFVELAFRVSELENVNVLFDTARP